MAPMVSESHKKAVYMMNCQCEHLIMQGTRTVNTPGEPNLDSSKVLDWADLFKDKTDNKESTNRATQSTTTASSKPNVATTHMLVSA